MATNKVDELTLMCEELNQDFGNASERRPLPPKSVPERKERFKTTMSVILHGIKAEEVDEASPYLVLSHAQLRLSIQSQYPPHTLPFPLHSFTDATAPEINKNRARKTAPSAQSTQQSHPNRSSPSARPPSVACSPLVRPPPTQPPPTNGYPAHLGPTSPPPHNPPPLPPPFSLLSPLPPAPPPSSPSSYPPWSPASPVPFPSFSTSPSHLFLPSTTFVLRSCTLH
ncbi:vegetative cell wall protein gp1-like [Homalodisca vitripennis]|uniref:vegetative cell wall protein gp1-like n=1 Tax=Homalodisca vitripennis TaxID=197043 RepID=UPI001EEA1F45|nr:vegetative cell wall protein gp1-like [Homalodisca vitripennis]